MKIVGSNACPERVELDEPCKELGVLDFWKISGEGLIEVVMSIDQTRDNYQFGSIYVTCVGCQWGQFLSITDGCDCGSVDQY